MTSKMTGDYKSPSRSGTVPVIPELLKAAYILVGMKDRTETLRVGAQAPEFRLLAANRPGEFSLSRILTHGTLVMEFLRGTW